MKPLCPKRSLCRLPSVVLMIGVTASSMSAQDRVLTADDLFAIRSVGSPQVSPENEWVAYTIRTASLEDEVTETRIWMVSTSGGEPIALTSEGYSASNLRWSPDGRYLSFTANRDETSSQIWLLDRRGGEAQKLTEVKQGVGSYEWSPDGTRVVLTILDPEEEEEEEEKENKPRDPWVIDRLQIKRDGRGYLTGDRHTHLYVFDLALKDLTQITSGRWDESQPSWSPDGRSIAFVSNRTEDPDGNSNTDIWVVAADNADRGETLLRLTDYEGGDSQPSWSPDGQWITYVTDDGDPRFSALSVNQLAITSSAGGPRELVHTSLDRNVSTPQFTADGRAVLVSVQDSGERYLARIDRASARLTRLLGEENSMSAFSVGAGGTIGAVLSKPHLPGEVFLLENGDQRRLTRTNDDLLSGIRLSEVQNIHFPSRDGTEIEGWTFMPPGYDSKLRYPTILRIHGGPNGMYGVAFNFEAQFLAANGYVVLITNPRGSSGYGEDFSMALWQKWGIPDFDDVMAGVDHAIDEGYSDPDRLGLGGWSYGGILTNYVITKTDRFGGAITGASMALLIANFGHDHHTLGNEREWGLPWESREMWEKLSPFNAVDKVVTPTLIMGGEQDWNVPIQNSEQLYQALRRRGVPTQLVVYPGQPHGLRVPSYQKDRLERYLAWYDQWVKAPDKPVTDEL